MSEQQRVALVTGAAAQMAGIGRSCRRHWAAFPGSALGHEPPARRSRCQSRRPGRLDRHRDNADRAAAAKLILRQMRRQCTLKGNLKYPTRRTFGRYVEILLCAIDTRAAGGLAPL